MNPPKLFKGKGRIATDILGRRKYANYKQALNEAVANSLDAKSYNVKIRLGKDFIEIEDDGKGMSADDLENRYFTLGADSLGGDARSEFGIGKCAAAALGKILIVQSRKRDKRYGIKTVVDFDKVEKSLLGDYSPEAWETIDFSNKDYSTLIRIEKLFWGDHNSEEIAVFLTKKHWPILIDRDIKINIFVNENLLKANEPEDAIKHEFFSNQEFKIGSKYIPKLDLDCGLVKGTFYLRENGFGDDSSIDVYVKNQRIDNYSGNEVDWLKINRYLTSAQGFKSRIKGIIKVEAEGEKEYAKRSPMDRNLLQLKSDRTGFFEESIAFKQFCAYLIEKSNGKELNLPYGGILRLIHSDWHRKIGTDISKTQELIQALELDIKNDLNKIFEDEKLQIKKRSVQDELEKKTRQENKNNKKNSSENILFRCPKCQDILRIKIAIYEEWQKISSSSKRQLENKYWICETCGHHLNPLTDRYRRGPIKGKELMQIKLIDGSIARLLADAMGKNGIRSSYIPEESTIMINAEHAMLVYSYKTSTEAFKCYLLDSIIYAIAMQRAKGRPINEFQTLYNELSSKISKVIDISEYEETSAQLGIYKEQPKIA